MSAVTMVYLLRSLVKSVTKPIARLDYEGPFQTTISHGAVGMSLRGIQASYIITSEEYVLSWAFIRPCLTK